MAKRGCIFRGSAAFLAIIVVLLVYAVSPSESQVCLECGSNSSLPQQPPLPPTTVAYPVVTITPTPTPTATLTVPPRACAGSKMKVQAMGDCEKVFVGIQTAGRLDGFRCEKTNISSNRTFVVGNAPSCFLQLYNQAGFSNGQTMGSTPTAYCQFNKFLLENFFGMRGAFDIIGDPTPTAAPGQSDGHWINGVVYPRHRGLKKAPFGSPSGVVSRLRDCPTVQYALDSYGLDGQHNGPSIAPSYTFYNRQTNYFDSFRQYGYGQMYGPPNPMLAEFRGNKDIYLNDDCTVQTSRPADAPPVCSEFETNMQIERVDSPLVLALPDNAIGTTANPKFSQFPISLKDAGSKKWYSWPEGSSHALLVMLNAEGRVTSPTQLFGNYSSVASSRQGKDALIDGYQALSYLDTNRDGIVAAFSGEFPKELALWLDKNGNGISEPGEIRSMSEAGIDKLFVHPFVQNVTGQKAYYDPTTGNIGLELGYAGSADGKRFSGSTFDYFTKGYLRDPSVPLRADIDRRISGVWRFSAPIETKDGKRTAEGVLVLGTEGYNIDGFAATEHDLQQDDPSGAAKMIRVSSLDPGTIDIRTDGSADISFSIPSEFGKLTKTKATIDPLGKMRGHSQAFDRDGRLILEYGWEAEKVSQ